MMIIIRNNKKDKKYEKNFKKLFEIILQSEIAYQ